MKRLVLFCMMSVLASAISAGERFVDASTLTVVGKAIPTSNVWARVDTELYPDLTPAAARMFRCSAGIAVAFRTDSENISVRWTVHKRRPAVNQTAIAQSGFDLYILRDGQWIWAGVGKPEQDAETMTARVVSNMDSTLKECLLYLPLFAQVVGVEIGIDENALLESADYPFDRSIVVFGSSITHGAAASRAGMAYPAQLSRRSGLDFINLGISGNALLQPEVTPVVCSARADAYIFDCFSNPKAEYIDQRLMPFVEAVREAHPSTPLIFLQTIVREGGNFDLKTREFERAKREAAERGMKQVAERFEDVYFISVDGLLGDDHNATSDGTHPTDLGFERMLDKLEPCIMKILRKYDIR